MKNIFILTNSFPPQNIVGALRPYRLAKRIGHHGWRCIIITKPPMDTNSLDFSLLEELTPDTIIQYLYKTDFIRMDDKNKIQESIYKYRKHSGNKPFRENRLFESIRGNLRILLDQYLLVPDMDILHVSTYIKNVNSILKISEDNVILTTSPSHSIHMAGYFLSKKGLPWVADFRDPWDNYPETGHYELLNPIERMMEKMVIEQADAVISTTRTNTDNLVKKHSQISQKKFFTITNSYDKEKVDIPATKDPNKFVISYTGIFYAEKDPFTFFRALRSWLNVLNDKEKDKIEKILRIQLIGSKSKAVLKMVNDLKIDHVVRFVDRVSHEEAIRLTKTSDMVLISSGIGSKTRPGWLLSKLFEYLGCRIPILAICREGEMAKIIRETNSGYVITSEDHKAIHSILEKEINGKLTGNTNGNFTFVGVDQYEEKHTISQMINIIENVLNDYNSSSFTKQLNSK